MFGSRKKHIFLCWLLRELRGHVTILVWSIVKSQLLWPIKSDEKKEPRAGLDPAACCLQGSRSTGLSYRGN